MTKIINEKATAPAKETAAHIKKTPKSTVSNNRLQVETTLGYSLFRDPLGQPYGISDIRGRLEIKIAACLALGTANEFPVPDRIKNTYLASIIRHGRVLRGWCIKDLTEYEGILGNVSECVLLATLENPQWSGEDYALFLLLEQIETLANRAERGGRVL